jgi:magnesium transporter
VTRRITGDADASDDAIARRIASGEPFWLDLHGVDAADVAMLRDVIRLHPVALDDATTTGRRPKIEEYDDMTYLVAFGAAPSPDSDRLVEVHVIYAERFVVSLHQDASEAIDRVVAHHVRRLDPLGPGPALLYRLLDALTDSFLPAMDEVEDEIDAIEAGALTDPPRHGLQAEIYGVRRRLLRFRKVVMPQRDVLAQIAGGEVALPGVDENARRFFRSVEDHMIRVGELLDGYRDLLQGANDLYLSSVSTRLNAVTKQLTVIAGIFLPMSFITGFFGQNFGWLVDGVGGPVAFFVLGIGLQVLTIAVLLLWFRRRGWL